MNAFELISRSPGFSLENLFEKQTVCLKIFSAFCCAYENSMVNQWVTLPKFGRLKYQWCPILVPLYCTFAVWKSIVAICSHLATAQTILKFRSLIFLDWPLSVLICVMYIIDICYLWVLILTPLHIINLTVQGLVKRETRFTSQRPANEIMSKIEEAAKPLGFNVHKRNYKVMILTLDIYGWYCLDLLCFICYVVSKFSHSEL